MSIHLITGCMFSGKTSEIIKVAKMNKLLNKNVLIINYDKDTRYTDHNNLIITHEGTSFDCVPCAKDLLFFFKNKFVYKNADVVCINEGQFFDRLVEFCSSACSEGKDVYVCGLDGDYLMRPFGEILNLIPMCDSYIKLHALCMTCKNGTYASFTKKIKDSDNLIEIGSTEMYIPVCRKCHN